MQNAPLTISSKLPGIEQSIFSVMTALANRHGAINLAQGFPDFNCSAQLIAQVNEHMIEGRNQYAPMPGIMPLREKISAKIESLYGAQYDPEHEITITPGATHAIYTIISAVVREKEEVIIFEPAYDCYLPAILMNRAVAKYVTLEAPDYKINWEQVKKLITVKTRMIIINSPHNPTGMMLSAEDIVELTKIVTNREIIILSDEVYEHITFDGKRHESICRYPELASRSFAVSSFGKTYHTTGWKMGYVAAPRVLMDEFRKVYSYNMFSAMTPVQWAYNDVLDHPDQYLELSAFYQQKRDLFRDAISASRFKILPCEGAYFQLLDYSGISDENDRKLAEDIITQHGVASIPVSAFYHDKIDQKVLRFCFAKTGDVLKRAGDKLCRI